MNTESKVDVQEQRSAAMAASRPGVWKTLASIVVVMALFLGLFVHKITSPRILSPAELRANGAIVFDQPRILRDFQLLDHRGEKFSNTHLEGQWSLVFFGFSHCPDICPTALSQMNQLVSVLDDEIAEQVQVLMVSVDPARDTPEILASYVPHFNPEFTGVTGEFLQIMRIAQDVNVAFSRVQLENDYTIDHTGHLVLINPKGHYHGFFKAPFELARLKVGLSSIVATGL